MKLKVTRIFILAKSLKKYFLGALIFTISIVYSSLSLSNVGRQPEGAIRAAFIFNIMKYTQWESLPVDNLYICVANDAGSGLYLKRFESMSFRDKAIHIDVFDHVKGVTDSCNVVVLGKNEETALDDSLLNSSRLVICDGCQSGLKQAAVEIVKQEDRRLQFSVNLLHAQRAKIEFGSAMLEIAASVVKE